MCRLYGFRANHPTEVECELVEAQNSLIRQSEEDARGLVNDDGWGMGRMLHGKLSCERQVGPASESEDYRREALDARATMLLAHVRRATVGQPALENTHPFRHGRSLLIHNGHIGAFDRVRQRMLRAMTPEHRRAIAGTTDSEHFFHLLLSRRRRRPEAGLTVVLADAVRDVRSWVREVDREAEVALNVLWTVGEELVGSRLGRTLWYAERDAAHVCSVCGDVHPDPEELPDGFDYRAAVVASERITEERWWEVPEGSVLRVSEEMRVEVAPI